jgi:hypothetical protein
MQAPEDWPGLYLTQEVETYKVEENLVANKPADTRSLDSGVLPLAYQWDPVATAAATFTLKG